MCKYCEKNVNIFDSTRMQLNIEKLYENEYIIEATYDGCDENYSEYQIINYCLICGKKLREEE